MKNMKLGLLVGFILIAGSIVGTTSPASAQDEGEKVLIHAFPYDFAEFSYWVADSYATVQWNGPINAGLLKRSAAADRNYAVDLADGMPTASADAKTFTIKLKEDLVFNNGNPLTADDVVFSYNVVLTPNINLNSYGSASVRFASNDSIVKVDDLTVQFTLADTYAFANGLFTYPIIDQDTFKADYDACVAGDADACDWNSLDYAKATAGPYTFDNLDETNQVLTIVKNPNYWDADNVWSDKIIYKYIADKTAAIAELAAGSINIFDATFTALPDELTNVEGIIEKYVGDPAHAEMAVNHLNPFWGTGASIPDTGSVTDDAEQARLMRKAISHIIDRDYIAGEIQDGLAQPASSTMPSASLGWRSDLPVDEYDIALAKQIMTDIGFDFSTLTDADEDGVYETFFPGLDNITVMAPNSMSTRNVWSKLIFDTLPKLGISGNYVNVPWSVIIPRTFGWTGSLTPSHAEGGFDIMFVNYSWDLDWDPTGLYDPSGLPDQGSGDNYYNFVNASITAQVQAYTTELNADKRVELVGELQEMLKEQRPVIPLTYPQSHWAWDDGLLGIDELLISISSQEWGNIRFDDWEMDGGFLPLNFVPFVITMFAILPIVRRKK